MEEVGSQLAICECKAVLFFIKMGNSLGFQNLSNKRNGKWTTYSLYTFVSNEDNVVKYLEEMGMLDKEKICPACGTKMRRIGERWRCPGYIQIPKKAKRRCEKGISIRNHTWFARAHMPIPKVILMTFALLRNDELQTISHDLHVSLRTLTDWINFIRESLSEWSMGQKEKIGGEGKIVEIDESKFGKRKYHRGHYVEGQWIFGGMERGSGKIFMVPVEDRSAQTLIAIIKEYIAPGTTIISDCWKAYAKLEDEGYQHLTVNHSKNFKDPLTGAHTNGIESCWRHAKVFLPTYSRKKRLFHGYLSHHIFLKYCKCQDLDPLDTFFKHTSRTEFFPATDDDISQSDDMELVVDFSDNEDGEHLD